MDRDDRPDPSASRPAQTPDEGQRSKEEERAAPRVVDAGTSQELVIINYADDVLQSARERAVERNTREREATNPSVESAAESGGVESDAAPKPDPPREHAPPADPSLIIVRDAAFGWNGMESVAPAITPPPPAPPRRPAPVAPPPKPEPTAPSTLELLDRTPTASPPPTSSGLPATEAEAPPWARRANTGTFPPLPGKDAAPSGPAWIEPLSPSPNAPPRERRTSLDAKGAADPGARRTEPPRARPKSEEPAGKTARVRAPKPKAPRASLIAMLAGVAIFAIATVFTVLRVEPVHTWYYLFAWYPFLLVVNHATAVRSPIHSIFSGRARSLALLAAWSVPVWLVFELFNFRLENWYYIGVPDFWLSRRLGVLLSFATVLPGIFFLEEMQRVRGAFARVHWEPFDVTGSLGTKLRIAGIVCAALALGLPTFCFPLLWCIPVLLLEPWLHRRGGPSLLGDLAAGRPDRMLRLLVAGLACGLFWEAANYFAGGKWIYTVPGLAEGKLFEMPIPGFLGFAPFALACWCMARALVQVGLLPEWEVPSPATAESDVAPKDEVTGGLSRGVRMSLVAWAVLSCGVALEGMDRLTVDSRTPRPEDVPGIPPGVAEYARRHGQTDVRGLLALIEAGRMHIPGHSSESEIQLLGERCRLVLTRGIGTDNARRLDVVGVKTLDQLADEEPRSLTRKLHGAERGWWPRERRVAVWISAARDAIH